MLTEMLGKGGTLCSQARSGQIRCPLIVRPTSEDVITGQLAQTLRVLPARWWLPELLNLSLGAARFRRQHFRNFRIELWKNRPCFPSELLPWSEGSTQVDLTITWENPATTVLIEAKYLSGLSESVSGDDGRSGFPSDQLIRNIRVGLLETGYYDRGKGLFPQARAGPDRSGLRSQETSSACPEVPRFLCSTESHSSRGETQAFTAISVRGGILLRGCDSGAPRSISMVQQGRKRGGQRPDGFPRLQTSISSEFIANAFGLRLNSRIPPNFLCSAS